MGRVRVMFEAEVLLQGFGRKRHDVSAHSYRVERRVVLITVAS